MYKRVLGLLFAGFMVIGPASAASAGPVNGGDFGRFTAHLDQVQAVRVAVVSNPYIPQDVKDDTQDRLNLVRQTLRDAYFTYCVDQGLC